MDLYNWHNVPEEKINDFFSRWVIHTPEMTVAKLLLKKGAKVALHHHINAQLTQITEGALLFRFEMPGDEPVKEVMVRAGDVLPIPPNLPHSAEAVEDTWALDTFTPPRQDWIDGTDFYLRK